MKRIAVVGAGIAGLTAAYELERARRSGAEITYTIFESNRCVGGALRTERRDGFLIELGADSFLTEKPWAAELARELGIENELIGSNDDQRQTWILCDGELHPLPPGLQFIVPTAKSAASELFSEATRERFRLERHFNARPRETDESVASFIDRHFGRELLERVAEPMLTGIYGGDCERLSARAVMPRFVEMERTHGSLQRALEPPGSDARCHRPIFTSLKSGMQSLADGLARSLAPGSIRLNAAVKEVSRDSRGWRVNSEKFDVVIMAAPAFTAAELLQHEAPKIAAALREIRYTSSATVAFAYDARATKLPVGFGVLVPRTERQRMLACTFVHNKFPGRVPPGKFLVRAFFGGAHDERAVDLPEKELIALAQSELKQILGITAEPEFAMSSRWLRAMPQYEVGHLDCVVKINQLAATLEGLALCGSAYSGVGVPDCVRSGREVAKSVI